MREERKQNSLNTGIKPVKNKVEIVFKNEIRSSVDLRSLEGLRSCSPAARGRFCICLCGPESFRSLRATVQFCQIRISFD